MVKEIDALLKLSEQIKLCSACHLKDSRTNAVPGIYGPKEGLCFIGEAPGFFEDKQGLPFVGRSGKLLDKMLKDIGYSRKDVSILNVVKCRPTTKDGKNRTPTDKELKFCGELWLEKQLELLKPKVIITLGGIALRFFFPKFSVTRSVGKVFTTPKGYKLFATFHPAYILRNYNLLEEYEKHFQNIKRLIEKEKQAKEIMDNNKKQEIKQRTLTEFFQ